MVASCHTLDYSVALPVVPESQKQSPSTSLVTSRTHPARHPSPETNLNGSKMYSQPFQPVFHGKEEDMELFGLAAGLDINLSNFSLIDPRLRSPTATPDPLCNSVQPSCLISDANNALYHPGQPLIASSLPSTETFFGPGYPASHNRSSTPLSSIGSDTVFAFSQGSPHTQGSVGFMSPQLNYTFSQAPMMSSPPLLGLNNPAQAQSQAQAQAQAQAQPRQALPCSSYGLQTLADVDPDTKDCIRASSLDSQYPEPQAQQPSMALTSTKRRSVTPAKSESKTTSRKRVNNSGRVTKASKKTSKPSSRKSSPSNRRGASAIATRAIDLLTCRLCSKIHANPEALEDHIRSDHNRPFTCIFYDAGCQSSFTTKNEWKRHLNCQHLQLTFYLCRYKECADFQHSTEKVISVVEDLSHGKIFNRKDLYESHCNRLHDPNPVKKRKPRQPKSPEWAKKSAALLTEAKRTRCSLPQHLACPAPDCDLEFYGPTAWENRLEHIARHLEMAAARLEAPIRFGPENDSLLWAWAATSDVRIVQPSASGWELTLGSPSAGTRGTPSEDAESSNGSEDADGSV